MKNKKEATKFLEDQLCGIYFVDCYFHYNHGINIKFILNTNQLDLSKKHPDELYFYNKERKYLMNYSKKRNKFWLSNPDIWSKLEKDFGFNDQEVRELAKDILEIYFKCKISTMANHWYYLLS